MKIYEHIESHLGPIVRGWGPPEDTLGIQVSLFAHTPEQDLNTFCTLGLSKHLLSIGQKEVRQELLFSAPKRYSADAIASFAESIARSHHGLLRGAVVEGQPLMEGVAATGIYASVPVFWPDELHVFEDSSPKTVFVGLLPLVRKAEADVIASKGWSYFEDCLEGAEIDFRDKATARETIAAALSKANAEKLAAQLDGLTGKDYIDAYVKLAESVTPKLQRTALATDEEKGPTQVTIHIGGTSEQRKANSRNTAKLLE